MILFIHSTQINGWLDTCSTIRKITKSYKIYTKVLIHPNCSQVILNNFKWFGGDQPLRNSETLFKKNAWSQIVLQLSRCLTIFRMCTHCRTFFSSFAAKKPYVFQREGIAKYCYFNISWENRWNGLFGRPVSPIFQSCILSDGTYERIKNCDTLPLSWVNTSEAQSHGNDIGTG